MNGLLTVTQIVRISKFNRYNKLVSNYLLFQNVKGGLSLHGHDKKSLKLTQYSLNIKSYICGIIANGYVTLRTLILFTL